MAAISKAQQRFFGMVYAYKKGKLTDDQVSDEIINTANSISMKDAKKFASTKHNNLPNKISDNDVDEMYLPTFEQFMDRLNRFAKPKYDVGMEVVIKTGLDKFKEYKNVPLIVDRAIKGNDEFSKPIYTLVDMAGNELPFDVDEDQIEANI